jgi:hypothetical protein
MAPICIADNDSKVGNGAVLGIVLKQSVNPPSHTSIGIDEP